MKVSVREAKKETFGKVFRPYAVFEGNEMVGFTLGLIEIRASLVRDLEVFQELIRFASSKCEEGKEDQPEMIVHLEDNYEVAEWLLNEKFKMTETYNLMVYKDHFYQKPQNGWLFFPSTGGF